LQQEDHFWRALACAIVEKVDDSLESLENAVTETKSNTGARFQAHRTLGLRSVSESRATELDDLIRRATAKYATVTE